MNNPLFDNVKESLRNLTPDKAEQIKTLMAKRLLIAQYGPKPPMSEQLIADRFSQEKL